MSRLVPPGSDTVEPPATDIGAATALLFAEIANGAADGALASHVQTMNANLARLRPYEATLITDREAEFAALSSCWAQRDLPRLRELVRAYFQRRQDIIPELVKLINAPN